VAKPKEDLAMTTQTLIRPEQNQNVENKIQQVRKLYADAPELGKVALKNGLSALRQELGAASASQTAGRVGVRQGNVSELTVIVPFAEGGAKRLGGLLQLLQGNFQSAEAVGTLHDMRFVFLDNDTKLLFASAYDGDWDAYIDDFATKIPNTMDLVFCNCEGWPGIRNPAVKDWIVKHQIASTAWYVGSPDLTVAETRRLQKIGAAVEEFLDKVG